jgi:hypothetical protein
MPLNKFVGLNRAAVWFLLLCLPAAAVAPESTRPFEAGGATYKPTSSSMPTPAGRLELPKVLRSTDCGNAGTRERALTRMEDYVIETIESLGTDSKGKYREL